MTVYAPRGMRAKARAGGGTRYSTGIPCENGHLAERMTGTGICVECQRAKRKRRPRPKKSERTLLSEAEWRAGVKAARPKPECCEICGEDPAPRSLHLDHCHRTGAFRGWLCPQCNQALGLVKDDPKTLRTMIDYIKMYELW